MQSDKAVALLEELSHKLGSTVEQLWPHAVRYIMYDALFGTLFGSLLAFAGGWALKKVLDADRDSNSDLWVLGGAALVGIIGCIIAFSNIPILIEPEGYLVRNALNGVTR